MPRDDRIVVFPERGFADRDDEADVRRSLPAHSSMLGKARATDHAASAARLRQIGDLVGCLAIIGRYPHRADAEAGEHGFEHLVAVGGLNQHAVALRHAELGDEGRGHRVDARLHLRPAPAPLAPDEADAIGITPRRLRQKMRQVHHPRRARRYPCTRSHCHVFRSAVRTVFIWKAFFRGASHCRCRDRHFWRRTSVRACLRPAAPPAADSRRVPPGAPPACGCRSRPR